MDIKMVLIEFIVTFAIIYLLYYVFVIKKCRKNEKMAPAEVNLILSVHKIDVNKINLNQMIKVVSIVTTFIISTIITVIGVFFDNTIILLIFGTLISITVAIICYRLIGKYYEKQSKKDEKGKKKGL